MNNLIDLLPDPTKEDLNEAEILDTLRWETIYGDIATVDAWAFFSTGGKLPKISLPKKPTPNQLAYKKRADTFFETLQNGNEKCLSKTRNLLRTYLTDRQRGFCCYCRRQLYLHGMAINIDHVLPKTPGTKSALAQSHARKLCFDVENLAVCCIDCNVAKRTARHTFHPNLANYADYISYKILISPTSNVVAYKRSTTLGQTNIANEIYQVFKLWRLEIRQELAALGGDEFFRLIEASMVAAGDDVELRGKLLELAGIHIDRLA
ncbi:HNH endonuclease [Herbaspirillum huttiense]|uniref:HNH endonuclease n=1 Tax=Herbaspirillum huttiense TaxID=863372 RepID=UPI0039AF141E